MKRFLSQTLIAAAFAVVSCMGVSANAQVVTVAFDDFEGLTMQPFTLNYGNPFFLDGTDYTKAFPTGWALDNSQNGYDNTNMPPEFDGWSLIDVASWIGHAGVQAVVIAAPLVAMIATCASSLIQTKRTIAGTPA